MNNDAAKAVACEAITEFQRSCQKYFTCYVVASQGLEARAGQLKTLGADRSKTIFVGKGHPDEGQWHGSMNIGEFFDSAEADGLFSDRIAKSFLTAMYAEWDELYRHRIAQDLGVAANAVMCDLMGDVRLIRHCIVHHKSMIDAKHQRVSKLAWELPSGELRITKDMFSTLIDQINKMQVRIEARNETGD